MPHVYLLGFAILNLITIGQFWRDKRLAIAGRRRIPEADLLALALIGGTPGAFFARAWFRHKTRKEPFSTRLALIGTLQAGALIGFVLF